MKAMAAGALRRRRGVMAIVYSAAKGLRQSRIRCKGCGDNGYGCRSRANHSDKGGHLEPRTNFGYIFLCYDNSSPYRRGKTCFNMEDVFSFNK